MQVPELYREVNELLTTRLLPEIKYKGRSKGRRNTFGWVPWMMKYVKPPHRTPNNWKYGMLYLALRRLGDAIVPFKYDSITVNQNNVCAVHCDKGNLGSSLIVSGGDYVGGELRMEFGTHGTGCIRDWEEVDTKYKPFVFDGHRRHWNNDIISGFKWSIVYFKIEILPKWMPLFPADVNDPNRAWSLLDEHWGEEEAR